MIQKVKDLYDNYNLAKKALVDVMQKKDPTEPVTPKYYKDERAYEDHQKTLLDHQLSLGNRRAEVSAAEANVRAAKRSLLEAMDGQVWYPTTTEGLWIAKVCDDWPQSEPEFLEKNVSDPEQLPQLKFKHISSN